MPTIKINLPNDNNSGSERPWLVTFYQNRKRTRRSFATRIEAEHYAADVRAALNVGHDPMAKERAVRLCAGSSYRIDEIVEAALAAIKSGALPRSPKVTFAAGANLYLENQARGGANLSTHNRSKSTLKYLLSTFGDAAACVVDVHGIIGQRLNPANPASLAIHQGDSCASGLALVPSCKFGRYPG